MAKFIIKGGKTLKGEIKISGNKNAILPIMAATLLTQQECFLENVPKISDVLVMGEILKDIGAEIEGLGTDKLKINTKGVNKFSLNPELVQKLRASILLLGPLLARFGKARLRHPGGCIIGRRAVGTHFDALEVLGAKTINGEEDYESEVKTLHPGHIFLDEISVTATENAMMMASLIPGVTVIEAAACEPHVEDLAQFLTNMGVRIEGAGTNRITIYGSKNLRGTKYRIGPDYIDAGTFAVIGAVTKSKLSIVGVKEKDLPMILLYFKRMGVEYKIKDGALTVFPSKLVAPTKKVQTRPWPGFPTDLMSPLIVLATQAEGTTLCHDWMYESRMFFVDKLITMGAKITLCDPHRVLVTGPTKLKGKNLESPDIRAGMALVLAALCAQGKSEIANIEMIERGYENIEGRLRSLGADIKRVE
ncbi:MAG TPA: UDP-N-acetylglucosamine 1-carboxyvinyltransferase [Nevskiaceae bacterium]|nr:UDP-N-acetylglucosamine 1-carboxyvinyltransferase [Nevskiaceae bacterium]